MIGLRRVAGRGADAAVAFGNEVFARESLVAAVAPVDARLGVEVFSDLSKEELDLSDVDKW